MKQVKIILPAMGEGIFEATITQWLVKVGEKVQEDDSLVEIATDKVDSEVPSPADGIIKELKIAEGEVAKIGDTIAIIEVEAITDSTDLNIVSSNESNIDQSDKNSQHDPSMIETNNHPKIPFKLNNGNFLSPLVRSIAYKEQITLQELQQIKGSGLNGRIIKDDLLSYIATKKANLNDVDSSSSEKQSIEIIEMDRMRKLIAENMVNSKKASPHVTSFHEVDVTNMVKWREKYKQEYLTLYNEKITFTPFFIDAVAKAIEKYPLINVSVEDDKILKKNNINIGMATALPDGNLIVPVIHNANKISTKQLTEKVNDLANRARNKQLKPHEIQGGTFTLTNVGSFQNLSGTPIINQPEVAILAVGAIKKRPAVIETPDGDFIGIRHQLILSLSYDHRVVDGSLGGMFLKQIADNLEQFKGERWL